MLHCKWTVKRSFKGYGFLKQVASNFEYRCQMAGMLLHLVTSKPLAVSWPLSTTNTSTINNNNNDKHLYSRYDSKCFSYTNSFNPSNNTVTQITSFFRDGEIKAQRG